MTAFAMGKFLANVDSTQVTIMVFTQFFAFTGLPKLIIVDRGSEFQGIMLEMCRTMALNYHTVSRGNHKVIMVERFNKYFNKVEILYSANC